jgi:hypothetical protein
VIASWHFWMKTELGPWFLRQAKPDGARLSIARFPDDLRREISAEIDRLDKQTAEVAAESKTMAGRIRSDRTLNETQLREHRGSVEKMRPTTLAIAEQHNQIVASFSLWGDRPHSTDKSRVISEADGSL